MHNPLRRLRRNDKGSVTIEMAFIVPVFALAIFGSFELSDAFISTNKLQQAAQSSADALGILGGAANESQINGQMDLTQDMSGLTDIQGARGKIIYTAMAGQSDASGNATTTGTILWRRCVGALGYGSKVGGTPPTLPGGLSLKTTDTIIVAELYYNYRTPTGFLAAEKNSQGNSLMDREKVMYASAIFYPRDKQFGALVANPGGETVRDCTAP